MTYRRNTQQLYCYNNTDGIINTTTNTLTTNYQAPKVEVIKNVYPSEVSGVFSHVFCTIFPCTNAAARVPPSYRVAFAPRSGPLY